MAFTLYGGGGGGLKSLRLESLIPLGREGDMVDLPSCGKSYSHIAHQYTGCFRPLFSDSPFIFAG